MTIRHDVLRKLVVGTAVAGLGLGMVAPVSAAPIEAAIDAGSIVGLQQGADGAEVKLVQQALLDAGVSVVGGADGVFGPATASAVTSFQVREKLPTNGRVDEFTAAALGLVVVAAPTASAGPLQVGSRGDAVKAVQQQMLNAGVPVAGGADGIFGPGTKTAVSNFQRWNGLSVTGIVDATTAARIKAASDQKTGPTPPATASDPTVKVEATPDASSYAGLQVGARGDAVKQLQQKLQGTGLVVRGGADGIFGPGTKSSVQAFQKVNGLDQTGVVTAKVAEILGLGATAVTPAPAPSEAPTAAKTPSDSFAGLKVGNSGDAVKQLQRALQGTGLTVFGGADGAFGNATKSALQVFQKINGLQQTGVLSATGAAILGLGATAATSIGASGPTASGYAAPGESSSRTRALQEQLIAWNIDVVGGADSDFGSNTVAAVKRFQKIHGLTITGTVTAETAKALKLPPIDKIVPVDPSSVSLDRFPVQGRCYYGDTWHAARGGGRLHVGVDIIGEAGLLLYAVVDGEITKRFHDTPGALSGNGLRLTAADGTYFTYLHLLDIAPGIKIGTKVKAGDVIGFLGNTGSSATAHLHFEIHPGGGAPINPYPYVRAVDGCSNDSPRYQTSYAPAS